MKKLMHFLGSIAITFLAAQAYAQDHSHHAKHNMVLFGDNDALYASHVIYKAPHNFQVILKLELSDEIKTKIAGEMTSYPGDQFIYRLNPMDIGQIESKPQISGQIFRVSSDEIDHMIFEDVSLQADQYSVIYFEELPLSLQGTTVQETGLGNMNRVKSTPNENCQKIKCR